MPAADPAAPAGGLHVPADSMAALIAEQVITYLRTRPESLEPISVDAETAAKMVGCCSKTLAGLPAAEVGRYKLNRRTLYELATLRTYIRNQVNAN